jgi:pimeloyl-[acyl-carrier protein] methyl ester esterase
MSQTSVSDRYLESAGEPRLRYRDEGTGPAVLLVHGWLLNLTMWDELAQALSTQFRVIRWDRRGFGESAGTPNLAFDISDGLRLLQHLGVGPRAVLGMSQGCRIALSIAEAAPAMTTGLVLDGAPPLDGLPDRQWRNETPVFEYRALLVERGITALRELLAGHPLLQLTTTVPAMAARMRGMLERYAGADLLALPAAPPPGPAPAVSTDRFARLAVPALVLNGANDTEQRRRIGALLAELLPNATHALVPGSMHMACWDNPAAYNETVRAFLAANLNNRGPAAPGAS